MKTRFTEKNSEIFWGKNKSFNQIFTKYKCKEIKSQLFMLQLMGQKAPGPP